MEARATRPGSRTVAKALMGKSATLAGAVEPAEAVETRAPPAPARGQRPPPAPAGACTRSTWTASPSGESRLPLALSRSYGGSILNRAWRLHRNDLAAL